MAGAVTLIYVFNNFLRLRRYKIICELQHKPLPFLLLINMVALAFSEVLDTFEKLLAGFTYSILLLMAILYFNEAFVRKIENLGSGRGQKMAMQDKKKRRKRMKKIKWKKKKKARSRPEAASDPGCNPSPPTNSAPKQEAGPRSKENNGDKRFGTDNREVMRPHSAPGVTVRSAGASFKKYVCLRIARLSNAKLTFSTEGSVFHPTLSENVSNKA